MVNFEIILIALALSADAFSVALATSLQGFNSISHILRMSAYFGFFQFVMPLVGWLMMYNFQSSIVDYSKFISFALLFGLGVKMIYDHKKSGSSLGVPESIPTKGLAIMVLAIATSLDALAVGISFASLGQAVLIPSIIIGIICFITTFLAMQCSKLIAQKFFILSNNANLIGGTILIAIGFKILMDL